MIRNRRLSSMAAALALAVLLGACAQSQVSPPVADGTTPVTTPSADSPPATTPVVSTTCADPRASACTREYKPVCATRDTGVRCITAPCPSTELKTYGNACSACSDVKVISHVPGACPGG